MPPAYCKQAFQQLYNEDGVTVFARGAGIQVLLQYLCEVYCDTARFGRRLTFLLGASEEDVRTLGEALRRRGVPEASLPVFVGNETSGKERRANYARGGLHCVTSRILVVDLLNRTLDAATAAGLLVWNAHRINDTTTEAFIVRLYRAQNQLGFVKVTATCDREHTAAAALTHAPRPPSGPHRQPRGHVPRLLVGGEDAAQPRGAAAVPVAAVPGGRPERARGGGAGGRGARGAWRGRCCRCCCCCYEHYT